MEPRSNPQMNSYGAQKRTTRAILEAESEWRWGLGSSAHHIYDESALAANALRLFCDDRNARTAARRGPSGSLARATPNAVRMHRDAELGRRL